MCCGRGGVTIVNVLVEVGLDFVGDFRSNLFGGKSHGGVHATQQGASDSETNEHDNTAKIDRVCENCGRRSTELGGQLKCTVQLLACTTLSRRL